MDVYRFKNCYRGPIQILGYTLLVVISVFAVGCQAMTPTAALPSGPAGEHKNVAPAYYYFTAAQMKLKQGDINEAIWHLKRAIQHDPDSIYLKLEMANLLLIKKDDQQSLALIHQVLAKDPNHTQALTMAGRIYEQQNEPDKALAAYEKVLGNQPSDQGIYLLLGRIYWNKNDLNNAERVFQRMTINLPDSYAAYYFYGKALSAQGKLAQAEKALSRSLELEPSLEEPRLELLKIYKSQNQHQKVTIAYQAILDNDPDNYEAALGLAAHLHYLNHPDQSLAILADMGLRVDNHPEIISTLFEIYLETKRYAEAMWALDGMLKTAPKNADLHYMAGIALNGMERDEDALGQLLQVAPKSRFYTNAVVHSAMILHDLGKIGRAIKVVQSAILHDPDNIDYYLYLGSFYEELERFEEALEALREGLKKDAKNGRLHFRTGVVYDKMGRKEKSIAAMKNVLRLTPNDAEALNYLGYTYADMGINLDEAEMLIQSALKIKPNDGYITDSLGWVYFKRGNYSQALEWLTKAVKLVPDDPVILEHLGDVYLRMDSREKALSFYQRSFNKKSTDRSALREKIRTLTHR